MRRPDWVPDPAWEQLRAQPGCEDVLADLSALTARWDSTRRAEVRSRFLFHAAAGRPLPAAFIFALSDLFTYTPAPTPTATPTPTPTPTPTATPTRSSPHLTITKARLGRTSLRVTATLEAGARSPVTLRARFLARGRSLGQLTRRASSAGGRVRVTIALPRGLRNARRVRLELRYPGDTGYLPATARRQELAAVSARSSAA